MAKRQIIGFLTTLLACSTVLGVPTTLFGEAGAPSGVLWAGLAQTGVSDPNLHDASPGTDRNQKGLMKLTSTLFGGEAGDPNLSGLPNSAGTRELFIKMMISVVLVVVLGAAAIYGSKKLAGKLANMPGKRIKVVETAHLGPKKAVHLLRIGDRCLLIGSTNDNITKLADVTTEILMQEKASSDDSESTAINQEIFSAGFVTDLERSDALADLSKAYTEDN